MSYPAYYPGINLRYPMIGQTATKGVTGETSVRESSAETGDDAATPSSGFVTDTLNPDSDAALVARAVGGEMAAFGVLVERYQRPMAALVARMTDNPEDVEDIVQELFVRAWKGLPRFRGDAQFSTWLYRIAVNTAIKHRSRARNTAAVSLSTEDLAGGLESLQAPVDAAGSKGGDPFRAAQRKEREEAIRKAVASLPEKQRAVVVLHYFEGHSCEEISQIVGCSLGTVWSRLHYACKRLKGILEPFEAAG
ncbi:MAG: RNA polymerase sigma factor RpoE [Armatimonadaceae bacterium]